MDKDNTFTYLLTTEDEGKKLQDILKGRFNFSRKLIQKLKLGTNVWLDGEFVFLNSRAKAGQVLTISLVEEETATIKGEDSPLDIIYEDSLFLAVNKPAGQVVHPTGRRYQSGTLANAVVGLWEKQGLQRPFRPISRLDKMTSGVVLIAKSRYAHQQIATQTSQNLVQRKYLGLVQGQFPKDQGEFSAPIRLQKGSRILREIHEDGQSALTLYRTLKRYADYTLMEFTLVTGRTHQIRVHCQNSGYPLLGDDLYGGDRKFIDRQALHCSFYSFKHPLTEKNIEINAPLPKDIKDLL